MKSPELVKAMITARLFVRALPVKGPLVTTSGMGDGTAACAACDELIRATDVDCTCEFPLQPALHFHVDCFTEWRRQQIG